MFHPKHLVLSRRTGLAYFLQLRLAPIPQIRPEPNDRQLDLAIAQSDHQARFYRAPRERITVLHRPHSNRV